MTHDSHAIDSYANGLLAIATTELKEGHILRSHTIANGLCNIDFYRQGEARVIKAIASAHKHPNAVYEKSAKEFRAIVEDPSFQKPTVPLGTAHLGMAWAQIGLEKYDAASWAVEEAAKVFTEIGANPELGDAIAVQGLLEVPKGNLEEALKMLKRGSTFNAMNSTRALRLSHDGFEDSFERLLETESIESEFRALVSSGA